MALSTSGYAAVAILLAAPVAALSGFVFAARRRAVHITDAGTACLPLVAFVAVAAFREELHTGWAMIIWPVVIAVAALYALALKYVVVDPVFGNARRSSVLFLGVLSLAAMALGLFVPQLLE
jgi:hypothetical protein